MTLKYPMVTKIPTKIHDTSRKMTLASSRPDMAQRHSHLKKKGTDLRKYAIVFMNEKKALGAQGSYLPSPASGRNYTDNTSFIIILKNQDIKSLGLTDFSPHIPKFTKDEARSVTSPHGLCV